MNWVYAVLAILVICVLIAGGVWFTTHSAQAVAVKEQAVAGKAVVSQHQAQSNAVAQQIVVSGEARDRVTLDIQQHNDQAITAAQGSSERVPPAVANAIDDSLCQYPAYATDPECR